jgi:hypothetical protein
MGLHKDGTTLGLPPFETEIRRRIWWQIILLDCTYALMSGLTHSMIVRNWSTKRPTNINDADLFPTMKVLEERDGPTDMVLAFMNYELAQLLCEGSVLEQVILENERGLPDLPLKEAVDAATKRINKLDESMGEVERKYCDLSMGPVHQFAVTMRALIIEKLHELIRPMRDQPEWGTEIIGPKDHLFKISVTAGEHSLTIYDITAKQGFFTWYGMYSRGFPFMLALSSNGKSKKRLMMITTWTVKMHFQPELFLYMIGQLTSRTSGLLVERAWVVMEQAYTTHTELYDLTFKAHVSLAVYTLKAWKKREEVLTNAKGYAPEKPHYVIHLESLLGYEAGEGGDSSSKEQTPLDMAEFSGALSASTGIPITMKTEKAATDPLTGDGGMAVDLAWDQMLGGGAGGAGGFIDSSGIDWNMLGLDPTTSGLVVAPESQAAPGYPGFTGVTHWL